MKLLKQLLDLAVKFGQRFLKLTIIGQLAVLGILMYSSHYLTSCSIDEKINNLEIVYEETTKLNNTLKTNIKTLEDSSANKDIKIRKLTITVSDLSAQRKVLLASRNKIEQQIIVATDTITLVTLQDTAITTLKEELVVADNIITTQEQIIDERVQQVNLLTTALNTSETRADLLEKTLDDTFPQLNKKDKIFGIIPMPSRKVVAATAFVGGIYLGRK